MHPQFIKMALACAGWLYLCGAITKRGIGARIGLALVGVIEFFVVFGILEQVMKKQGFFLRALSLGPDIEPIMTYVMWPAVFVVLLSGLWLIKRLRRPTQPDREVTYDPLGVYGLKILGAYFAVQGFNIVWRHLLSYDELSMYYMLGSIVYLIAAFVLILRTRTFLRWCSEL